MAEMVTVIDLSPHSNVKLIEMGCLTNPFKSFFQKVPFTTQKTTYNLLNALSFMVILSGRTAL